MREASDPRAFERARVRSRDEDRFRRTASPHTGPRPHPFEAEGQDPESRANDGYRLLEALRDQVGGMLLLTATPMQLHDFELYSMVELVEPGLFNGFGDFSSSRGRSRRSTRGDDAQVSHGPPMVVSRARACSIIRCSAASSVARSTAARGPPCGGGVAFSLSSLASALVRNRKAEIGGFTSRSRIGSRSRRARPSSSSSRLLDYIRQRYASADRSKRTAVGLVLVAFQKMLCSSSHALAGALETRLRGCGRARRRDASRLSDDPDLIEEDAASTRLADRRHRRRGEHAREPCATRPPNRGREARRLEELVDRILARDPSEKVLIFSQFLESIEMIRARLAASALGRCLPRRHVSRREGRRSRGFPPRQAGADLLRGRRRGS